jgi:hypothetical protein
MKFFAQWLVKYISSEFTAEITGLTLEELKNSLRKRQLSLPPLFSTNIEMNWYQTR